MQFLIQRSILIQEYLYHQDLLLHDTLTLHNLQTCHWFLKRNNAYMPSSEQFRQTRKMKVWKLTPKL